VFFKKASLTLILLAGSNGGIFSLTLEILRRFLGVVLLPLSTEELFYLRARLLPTKLIYIIDARALANGLPPPLFLASPERWLFFSQSSLKLGTLFRRAKLSLASLFRT